MKPEAIIRLERSGEVLFVRRFRNNNRSLTTSPNRKEAKVFRPDAAERAASVIRRVYRYFENVEIISSVNEFTH
jgi:hypothetical protein